MSINYTRNAVCKVAIYKSHIYDGDCNNPQQHPIALALQSKAKVKWAFYDDLNKEAEFGIKNKCYRIRIGRYLKVLGKEFRQFGIDTTFLQYNEDLQDECIVIYLDLEEAKIVSLD